MGWHAILSSHRLDEGLVLAPERYDPRRSGLASLESSVGDIASVVSEQLNSRSADPNGQFVVFNTGDAQEGVLVSRPAVVDRDNIGSSKKLIREGDVIISRLRPYLRQVAFVDPGLTELVYPGAILLCSTEFYVLRSRDSHSIAFLVPFLLSEPVQEILAAAQEGGHHPRFDQRTLDNLGMPQQLLSQRKTISKAVEESVAGVRLADSSIRKLIESVWTDGA